MTTKKAAAKEGGGRTPRKAKVEAQPARGGARPKEREDDGRGGVRPGAGRKEAGTQGLSCRAPKWLVAWIDAQPGESRGTKTLALILEAAKARGATPPPA